MVSRTPTKQPLFPLPRAASGSPTKPTPSPSPSPASARGRRVLRRGEPREDQVARRNVRHLPPRLPPPPPQALRPPRRPRLPHQAPRRRRRLPPPPLPAAVAVSSNAQAESGSGRLAAAPAPAPAGVAGEEDAVPGPRRDAHPLPDRPGGAGAAGTSPCAPSSRARRSPSTSSSAPGSTRSSPRRRPRSSSSSSPRGLPEYASLVLDRLDPRGALFAHRLYRGACRDAGDGRLVKDLAATGRDLRRAVIVDDNPNAYSLQPDNAVPVAPFIDDADDHELERVMGILSIAAEFDDVRDAIKRYKEIVEAS
ncbi:hypothetical protein OsJ_17495 [Oryza sativa Japonica Group]|uniref:Mitochondrial import inner membrane translocase subunit TIM50 n=1 Tax=Oryza sativa subsp. japonica TaxID=39947 RepID=B9FIT4_ORYSJ|nr:hypothetical protein OsJ_17495 [Oryza sativa Japonica Group]